MDCVYTGLLPLFSHGMDHMGERENMGGSWWIAEWTSWHVSHSVRFLREFTKLLLPVAQLLRLQGVPVYMEYMLCPPYRHGCTLKSSVLQNLGCLVNFIRSELVPIEAVLLFVCMSVCFCPTSSLIVCLMCDNSGSCAHQQGMQGKIVHTDPIDTSSLEVLWLEGHYASRWCQCIFQDLAAYRRMLYCKWERPLWQSGPSRVSFLSQCSLDRKLPVFASPLQDLRPSALMQCWSCSPWLGWCMPSHCSRCSRLYSRRSTVPTTWPWSL